MRQLSKRVCRNVQSGRCLLQPVDITSWGGARRLQLDCDVCTSSKNNGKHSRYVGALLASAPLLSAAIATRS
jgi:hypothetical protein